VLSADNRLEMDPDARVREAIHLVFAKFRELGSARQVILWMRQEGIELPACQAGAANRKTTWRLAGSSLRRFLTNPIYRRRGLAPGGGFFEARARLTSCAENMGGKRRPSVFA
jgi:hypothetical protein